MEGEAPNRVPRPRDTSPAGVRTGWIGAEVVGPLGRRAAGPLPIGAVAVPTQRQFGADPRQRSGWEVPTGHALVDAHRDRWALELGVLVVEVLRKPSDHSSTA